MAQTKSPGWYPAPDGNGRQWWNGVAWSESRQGAAQPVAQPIPSPAVSVPAAPSPAAAPPPVYSAENPPPLVPGQVLRPAPVLNVRSINASVNRNAMIGFTTGVISVFFNVLFVLAPIAIVFSIMGLSRARQLKAQGATTTLAGFAWAGLAAGVFAAVLALVQVVVFLVSMFSFEVDASAFMPASGLLPWLLQR
jgi:hypothetical protein